MANPPFRSRAVACGGLLACLWGALAHAQAQPSPSAADEARRRFARGVTLYESSDFAGALAEFEAAYRAVPRTEVLFNIGITQRSLFRYGDAVRTLRRYLEESRGRISAARASAVEKELAEIRALTAEVTVHAEPEGAAVEVDGARVGQAPLSGPLLLGPGTHRLRVAREGFVTDERELSLVSGGAMEVRVALTAVPKTGRLELTTTPAARVTIDGIPRGLSPLSVELAPGGHQVLLEQDGYRTQQQEVLLVAGQSRQLALGLVPVPPSRPVYKRWYFWTAVAVGAVAAGAGTYQLTRRRPDVTLNVP